MIEALDTKNDYREKISRHVNYCLTSTNLTTDEYYKGKVRDRYDLGEKHYSLALCQPSLAPNLCLVDRACHSYL